MFSCTFKIREGQVEKAGMLIDATTLCARAVSDPIPEVPAMCPYHAFNVLFCAFPMCRLAIGVAPKF